ncbi:MAG: hypothetical protein EVA89_19800 [Sandaracinaceae bacterium]|nr:MAG: hypothetical protein EVA89_19800 [Sandaracinaceae bacterium]
MRKSSRRNTRPALGRTSQFCPGLAIRDVPVLDQPELMVRRFTQDSGNTKTGVSTGALTLRLAPGQPPPDDIHAAVAAQFEQLRSLRPLERPGTPDDVAAAVAYLLDAEWVPGSVLSVDGGLGVS